MTTDTTIPLAAPTSTTPAAAPATPTSEAAPIPGIALIDIQDFAKVKLCVAQIESVEKIEKSKKLYKIQVDVGAVLGKRQIVSGIAQFYTPEQLVGRKIIIVSNLKPAQLMGTESQGMLLAASTSDRTALSLLTPAEEIPVGSYVS
jgi:methionyl-tRNA synthetase